MPCISNKICRTPDLGEPATATQFRALKTITNAIPRSKFACFVGPPTGFDDAE